MERWVPAAFHFVERCTCHPTEMRRKFLTGLTKAYVSMRKSELAFFVFDTDDLDGTIAQVRSAPHPINDGSVFLGSHSIN
jgi:hypothetical protein